MKVSSPTIEWSLASACTVHVGWATPSLRWTSTRAVAVCASTTSQAMSCDWTSGVDWTKVAQASHASDTTASTTTPTTVTRRRHAGGAAYRSERA